MSDMSRNRGEPMPAAAGLAKVLEAAVNSRQKTQKQELPEDFNTLVLPTTQKIEENCIFWTWIVHGEEVLDYFVTGKLYTKGDQKGDYEVAFTAPETTIFRNDEAKDIGKALISAWNYHNVWKDHAGYFIEKEVMGE